MLPTVGRIVHYTLPRGRSAGEVRSATIVRVFSDTCVNLVIHLDGSNDEGFAAEPGALFAWETSVVRDEPGRGGCWFWPPRT